MLIFEDAHIYNVLWTCLSRGVELVDKAAVVNDSQIVEVPRLEGAYIIMDLRVFPRIQIENILDRICVTPDSLNTVRSGRCDGSLARRAIVRATKFSSITQLV